MGVECVGDEVNIDPQRLIRLAVLMEHRSFRRAAEHLGLTQPALSQSIAQIEREVGVKLIERTPHGLEPTIYGHALYEHAKSIDRELAQAAQRIQELAFGHKGALAIGATAGGAASLVALAICRFQQSRPGTDIRVNGEPSIKSLLSQLHDRTVDMLICQRPSDTELKGTRAFSLFRANRVACVRTGHPLEGNVTLHELSAYPFVCPQEELELLFGLRQIFSSIGRDPPEVLVTNSLYIAKEIVLSSDSFTIFSDVSVLNEQRLGLLRLIELGMETQYWMQLLLREEQTPSDIVRHFLTNLLAVCEELDIEAHPDAVKFKNFRAAAT